MYHWKFCNDIPHFPFTSFFFSTYCILENIKHDEPWDAFRRSLCRSINKNYFYIDLIAILPGIDNQLKREKKKSRLQLIILLVHDELQDKSKLVELLQTDQENCVAFFLRLHVQEWFKPPFSLVYLISNVMKGSSTCLSNEQCHERIFDNLWTKRL